MKYLFFLIFGIVIIWNPLDIDPFTTGIIEETFSQVAPKELVRPMATVSYIEAGVKIKLGMDCVKKGYDIIDLIQEMPSNDVRKWRKKFHNHIQSTQGLCEASKEINGF